MLINTFISHFLVYRLILKLRVIDSHGRIATCCVGVWTAVISLYRAEALKQSRLLLFLWDFRWSHLIITFFLWYLTKILGLIRTAPIAVVKKKTTDFDSSLSAGFSAGVFSNILTNSEHNHYQKPCFCLNQTAVTGAVIKLVPQVSGWLVWFKGLYFYSDTTLRMYKDPQQEEGSSSHWLLFSRLGRSDFCTCLLPSH